MTREEAIKEFEEENERLQWLLNNAGEDIFPFQKNGICRDIARNKVAISALKGECRNCKWWKDSDGKYRRGIGAESKCPINTVIVCNGYGYCYMFEPKGVESEVKPNDHNKV